jgi:hypothetical protein
LEFVKITCYGGDNLRKIQDVSYIRNPENTLDLSNKLAHWILNKNPDSGIIGIDLPVFPFGNHHINLDLIQTVIRITGYPVLYIPESTIIQSLKNILFPLPSIPVHEIEFQKFFPLLKCFNSNVYLLNVKIPRNEYINNFENEWCEEQVQLLKKNKIQVKAICINHKNEAETILAYASIIRADLIFNSVNISGSSIQSQNNNTWQFLIQQSKIPLFNYLN